MEIVEIAAIGLLVGFTGGMFGIGGGIVLIPALTELRGPNQHLYQATAMIVNFFVAVPAAFQHWRAGAIEAPSVARMLPVAVLFVLVGVGLSEIRLFAQTGEHYLRGLFGLFLLGAGISEIHRSWCAAKMKHGDRELLPNSPKLTWRRASAIAVPTGFVAGFLGVGGGILAVPLQRRLLGAAMHKAIANSTVIIIATSAVGAVSKNYAYSLEQGSARQPLLLAAVLVPTAIVGSLLGSTMTHRVRGPFLRDVFVVLLILTAFRQIAGVIQPAI